MAFDTSATRASTAFDTSAITWSQVKGTARTFRPRTDGVLRVRSGRAWATLDTAAASAAGAFSPQPRWCPVQDAGDIFVGPGADLALRAGQAVVLESWPSDHSSATELEWLAAAACTQTSRWQIAVRPAARDLGQGLLQVARALGQLLQGLAGYSEHLVAGRGKVQACLESNAP